MRCLQQQDARHLCSFKTAVFFACSACSLQLCQYKKHSSKLFHSTHHVSASCRPWQTRLETCLSVARRPSLIFINSTTGVFSTATEHGGSRELHKQAKNGFEQLVENGVRCCSLDLVLWQRIPRISGLHLRHNFVPQAKCEFDDSGTAMDGHSTSWTKAQAPSSSNESGCLTQYGAFGTSLFHPRERSVVHQHECINAV